MRELLLKTIGDHIIANPESAFALTLGGVEDDGKNLRYWPWEAGQREEYPYAVSFIVSDSDAGAIMTSITSFEWQMMLYTKTITEGNALARFCKALFADASLVSAPGCAFTCVYLATYGPMREGNNDPFQTTVTFSCYI